MSVNKVILIGNVGKDPDVRYLENNLRVANFPLATTERGYTMSNGTQVPDRTEWHSIVVWRALAEATEKYVKKGTQLYIEGHIKSRSYEDKSGIRRYITEIYADDMKFLGGRRDAQQNTTPQNTTTTNEQTATQPVNKLAQNEVNNPSDDNLPF